MTELGEVFSGTKPLTRVEKNGKRELNIGGNTAQCGVCVCVCVCGVWCVWVGRAGQSLYVNQQEPT